jgi:predicted metal-binding membrane protein
MASSDAAQAAAYPRDRAETYMLAALLGLAAAGWAFVAWQSQADDGMSMGLTMGMGAPLFLASWVAMMAAMMFPTAAPMIRMFARISSGKRARGEEGAPTWIFVAGYLGVWVGVGVPAYLLARGAEDLSDRWMWVMDNAPRLGGAVLLGAGLYQLSPLKTICLRKCRTPISFVLTSWREGRLGALRMGFRHGAYCLGCCWALFAILFPLGIMNVAAMVAVTALVFAEKSLPGGERTARAAAGLLAAYGLLVVFVPGALPTTL